MARVATSERPRNGPGCKIPEEFAEEIEGEKALKRSCGRS
jgi:hypothetical protein